MHTMNMNCCESTGNTIVAETSNNDSVGHDEIMTVSAMTKMRVVIMLWYCWRRLNCYDYISSAGKPKNISTEHIKNNPTRNTFTFFLWPVMGEGEQSPRHKFWTSLALAMKLCKFVVWCFVRSFKIVIKVTWLLDVTIFQTSKFRCEVRRQ